jgi:hypothetical protein
MLIELAKTINSTLYPDLQHGQWNAEPLSNQMVFPSAANARRLEIQK